MASPERAAIDRPGLVPRRMEVLKHEWFIQLKLTWAAALSPSKRGKWPSRRTAPLSFAPETQWYWFPLAWRLSPNREPDSSRSLAITANSPTPPERFPVALSNARDDPRKK